MSITNRDKESRIVRITLDESDGSQTVINISEDLHYLLGFTKVGKEEGKEVPMEISVHGNQGVVGEIFFQIGEQHPELIHYCARRSAVELAKKAVEELKKSGVDPMAEFLKNAPTKGGVC